MKVALGDDYYQGAYFSTVSSLLDYEVPRSQLERWEAAAEAYEAMQTEIERVMRDQTERVRALRQERNPSRVVSTIQEVYGPVITAQLAQFVIPPLKEPE